LLVLDGGDDGRNATADGSDVLSSNSAAKREHWRLLKHPNMAGEVGSALLSVADIFVCIYER